MSGHLHRGFPLLPHHGSSQYHLIGQLNTGRQEGRKVVRKGGKNGEMKGKGGKEGKEGVRKKEWKGKMRKEGGREWKKDKRS